MKKSQLFVNGNDGKYGTLTEKSAFSLAEMMVVMLIMSIVLAALAPVITTRIKADQALKAGEAAAPQEDNNPWKWVEGSETDAYSQASRNMIGQSAAGEDDGDAMLIINKGKDDYNGILFKNSKGILGRLDVWNFYNNDTTHNGIVLGEADTGSKDNKKYGGISIGFENTLKSERAWDSPTWSVILGYKNTVANGYSIAIGQRNTTTSSSAVAIGERNTAGNNSIVFGYGNTSESGMSTIVGRNNESGSGYAYLFGSKNTAGLNFTTTAAYDAYAVGELNKLDAQYSVVVGAENTTALSSKYANNHCYAFGEKNSVSGNYFSMAVGDGNEVTGSYGIAIGKYACATGNSSMAIGVDNISKDSRTEPATTASGSYSVAIGWRSLSSGNYSIALGSYAKASGESSIAISANSFVNEYAVASGKRSVAIGYKAQATSDYDFVLGSSLHNVKIPGTLTVNGTKVTSDKRLKYIKGENKSGLDAVRKMKVYNFTFKKDQNKEPRVGVIAQELQKILPDAVKKGSDGFLTIRIDDIIYTLVNAVKELDRKVSELTETLKQVQSEQKRIRTEQKRINQRLDALEHKSVH